MFCSHCGRKIPDIANYCSYCGEQVTVRALVKGTRTEYPNEHERLNRPAHQNESKQKKTKPASTESKDFFSLSEYVIDEKMSILKFANAYKVYDIFGNEAGSVRQVNISGGAIAARLLIGHSAKSLQSFQYHLMDTNGNVVSIIKRAGIGSGFSALRTVLILGPDEKKQGNISFKPGKELTIDICDEQDTAICQMIGSLLRYNFVIKDPNGNQIGEINKEWTGVARELFSTSDKYRVKLYDNCKKEQKHVIAAAAIAIDMILHEF